jgi:hypothetical protein
MTTAHTPAQPTFKHDSDCAVHNAPALPIGPCDCSMTTAHTPDTPVSQLALVREWAEGWDSSPYEDSWKFAAQEVLAILNATPQPVIAPEWVMLTDSDIDAVWQVQYDEKLGFAHAIEAAFIAKQGGAA